MDQYDSRMFGRLSTQSDERVAVYLMLAFVRYLLLMHPGWVVHGSIKFARSKLPFLSLVFLWKFLATVTYSYFMPKYSSGAEYK